MVQASIIGGPAYDRPVIGRAFKRGGFESLTEDAGVAVVDGEAALGVDDLALGLDDLGVEGEVLDAVGFHVEEQLERGGGGPVGVGGEVVGGGGVVVAAGVVHGGVEFTFAVLLRAVEHHVLEEVREAGDAFVLVARADLVEGVEGDVGDGVVFLHEDGHAVGKGLLLHVEGSMRGDQRKCQSKEGGGKKRGAWVSLRELRDGMMLTQIRGALRSLRSV